MTVQEIKDAFEFGKNLISEYRSAERNIPDCVCIRFCELLGQALTLLEGSNNCGTKMDSDTMLEILREAVNFLDHNNNMELGDQVMEVISELEEQKNTGK